MLNMREKKEKLREMTRERDIMETRGMIVVIKRLDLCNEIFSFVFCQNTCMTMMVFFLRICEKVVGA